MLGKLNYQQIEEVLHNEVLGRIGCHAEGVTYIVPIAFAYDGVNIFARSKDGMKIDIMRKNPAICFEVESVKDMADWKTVIMWGNFVEVVNPDERQYALEQLLQRHLPIVTGELTRFTPNWPFTPEALNEVDGVVFKIDITEKTGRFENYQGIEQVSQPFL